MSEAEKELQAKLEERGRLIDNLGEILNVNTRSRSNEESWKTTSRIFDEMSTRIHELLTLEKRWEEHIQQPKWDSVTAILGVDSTILYGIDSIGRMFYMVRNPSSGSPKWIPVDDPPVSK